MKARACAKINPSLLITGRRPDGYHDLKLIFLPVDLADELTTEPNGDGVLRLTCSEPDIPIEDNLITKAWRLIRQDHPAVGGLDVFLKKNIPSGAGLGGGSADAAAFLKMINALYDLRLTSEQLAAYGLKLGADVPALLLGQASVGTGIGERLLPVPNALHAPVLIVKPPFSCSTKEMYARFDTAEGLTQPDETDAMTAALAAGDLIGVSRRLFNVFEQLLDPAQRAAVEGIKRELTANGAAGALLSGSGSCVFGLYPDRNTRDAAAAALAGSRTVYPAEIL